MNRKNSPYTAINNIKNINRSLVRLLVPLNINDVYKSIVAEAVLLVNAVSGSIFLFDEKENKFKRAFTTVAIEEQYTPRPNGNTYWVYKNNKPLLVPREDLILYHPEISTIVHSVLLIPLSFHKKGLGVLSIKSSIDKPFSNQELEILILFGTIASLAIRNSQLHKQQQKSLEMRDLFMSAASHELKTPLTTIRAYAQLLNKKQDQDKDSPAVNAIIRNTDKLTVMIDSLFLASQINAGTFSTKYEEFDMYELLKQIINDLRISFQRKINFVSSEKTILYIGDKLRLSSVFINIIKNAINYSKADSEISINIIKEKNNIIIKVQDKGKGILQKDLKHIFEKYFRPKQHEPGLGLGLYLCSIIVKAHDGEISIESKKRKGTTVTIVLPIKI